MGLSGGLDRRWHYTWSLHQRSDFRPADYRLGSSTVVRGRDAWGPLLNARFALSSKIMQLEQIENVVESELHRIALVNGAGNYIPS